LCQPSMERGRPSGVSIDCPSVEPVTKLLANRLPVADSKA